MKLKTTVLVMFTALLVFCLQASPQTQSRLATLAASMKPGTWALLNQDGDGSGYGLSLLAYDGVGSILGFASKAAYDPVSDRVYFTGTPHSGTTHTIHYDVASNRWTGTSTESSFHLSHTYDSNAVAPGLEHYVASDPPVRRFSLSSQTWINDAAPCPALSSYSNTFEYFPERGELLCASLWQLYRWNRITDTWSLIADRDVLGGQASHFIMLRYNPVHKVVLVPGGYYYNLQPDDPTFFSHAIYRYDQNGVITRMKDSPAAIHTGNNTGLVTVDPVSGDYLFLNSEFNPDGSYANRFTHWSYNIIADEWRDITQSSPVPSDLAGDAGRTFAVVNVPITKHGVVMYMSGSGFADRSKVYLYKHAAGSGISDTVAPSVPVQLTAQAVSSSQITLSWSPSTDNVAVAGYKLFQNGSQAATVITTTHSVTGLAVGSKHTFAVSAFDAAGNASAQSVSVAATTQSGGGGSDFAAKCGQPGVLACWPFDSDSELRYSWDTSSTALNQALAGHTSRSMTFERGPEEGNTFALQHGSGALAIPVIDKTVFSSGGGSFKLTIPSQSEPQSGWFQANFNNVLGNPSMYIAPGSPHGSEIYLQYKIRVSDTMLSTIFRQYWKDYGYQLSTPAAGSTRITLPPEFVPQYFSFTADMVGRMIAIQGPYPVTPWVKGIYTITSFVDAGTVTLDRSPTPTAAGTQGLGTVGSPDTPDYKAGGWKTDIVFGNSPNVGSSGAASVVTVNPGQTGIPVMYGQQGYDSYGWQDILKCNAWLLDPTFSYNPALYPEPPCKRFKPDQFIEITKYIKVGGKGTPDSHVKLWVDGVLAVDYPNAKVEYGSAGYADGLGQFDLTLYHTRKDPTQVHPTGYVWYDDVITSTQPIAMGGSTTPPPPPPTNAAPTILPISNVTTQIPSDGSTTASAVLTAVASDDGLPVGSTIIYLWSGPTAVKFGSPTQPATNATAPAGTYTITVTAGDGALTSQPRSFAFTVNPAVVIPPPPPGDTVAPVVSFKTLNNSTFSSNAKLIEFTASDNVGVVSCAPTVNGIAIQPTPIFTTGAKLPATIKFYIQQAVIPKETYILGVSCKDAAGNTGTAPTISVIRK